MAENQSIIGKDVLFKGKITNSKTIEIHGRVEADIKSEKITLGKSANYDGGIQADLVVISGKYQGKLKADSVWLTDSSIISGEINYKSLQMDRGAALNCRVVHNWNETDSNNDEETQENEENAQEEQSEEK